MFLLLNLYVLQKLFKNIVASTGQLHVCHETPSLAHLMCAKLTIYRSDGQFNVEGRHTSNTRVACVIPS